MIQAHPCGSRPQNRGRSRISLPEERSVAEKRRSAEAARQEIRESALDLFVAQGYGATSLEDIAGRLGRTRQAVLYHFKSKEELLRVVLDPYFIAVNEVLDELTT